MTPQKVLPVPLDVTVGDGEGWVFVGLHGVRSASRGYTQGAYPLIGRQGERSRSLVVVAMVRQGSHGLSKPTDLVAQVINTPNQHYQRRHEYCD